MKHEQWLAGARRRSETHARQTRKRASRIRQTVEAERLLALGVDPAWVRRMLPAREAQE
jgi:hypothetical protein